MSPVRVGIGLIGRGGRYLIRQRPPLPGSPMPGVWEFPGGKCEPDESPSDAVRRECLEETGLPVRVLRMRQSRQHHYPHGFVELHYFECEPEDPGAEPAPESGFIWVFPAEMAGLTFPDANGPILRELAAQGRFDGV